MLECVINISEGRDPAVIRRIAAAAEPALLDVHSDPHHNRSVLTVVGADAARAVATATVASLDLRHHTGAHPRLGVLDVVPFVALEGSSTSEALDARDQFARWLSATHDVPCFLYGPERSLPEVRRDAFRTLLPDAGPPVPHATAGATAVGQRDVLVAFNVWIDGADLATTKRIAAAVRGDGIRALGLAVGPRMQVSMNLVEPRTVGPAHAVDRVVACARHEAGVTVAGCELVGLVPASVLEAVPRSRWDALDLRPDRTIEARLGERGLR